MRYLPSTKFLSCFFGLAAWLTPAPAPASELFSSAFDTRRLYTLNQTTGAATNVGSAAPMTDVRDLASDTRPESYRLWVTSPNTGELFRLNPATGTPTRVGAYGLPAGETIRTLAFDAAGQKLYGTTGSPGALIANLYSIDADTAAPTLVGSTGLNDIGGAAFDWSGQLYVIQEPTGGLYRLDKTTGAATRVATVPVQSISDIAFRPEDNSLFAITHTGPVQTQRSTYTIDPTTGAARRLGPYGQNVMTMAGLAFGPGVPEPGAPLALFAGAVVLSRRTRLTRRR